MMNLGPMFVSIRDASKSSVARLEMQRSYLKATLGPFLWRIEQQHFFHYFLVTFSLSTAPPPAAAATASSSLLLMASEMRPPALAPPSLPSSLALLTTAMLGLLFLMSLSPLVMVMVVTALSIELREEVLLSSSSLIWK